MRDLKQEIPELLVMNPDGLGLVLRQSVYKMPSVLDMLILRNQVTWICAARLHKIVMPQAWMQWMAPIMPRVGDLVFTT